MLSNKIKQLGTLQASLRYHIIGQDEAISVVSEVVKRGELGLTNTDRPKGSFLFLGPTGVGKTELCRRLAQTLYGDHKKLARFDMSEYKEAESVSHLIGDRTGYEGRLGTILDQVGNEGILLFDEMEKAHREVLDILLQILDAARVTTGKGNIRNLSRFYVILTSNIGSERLGNLTSLNDVSIERIIHSALANAGFRIEFIGRFNEILSFNRLTPHAINEIAKLIISDECKRQANMLSQLWGEDTVGISFDQDVLRYITRTGSDDRYGARNMRSVVERSIQGACADALMNHCTPSATLNLTLDEDTVVLRPETKEYSGRNA